MENIVFFLRAHRYSSRQTTWSIWVEGIKLFLQISTIYKFQKHDFRVG